MSYQTITMMLHLAATSTRSSPSIFIWKTLVTK